MSNPEIEAIVAEMKQAITVRPDDRRALRFAIEAWAERLTALVGTPAPSGWEPSEKEQK